jgi:hypothetical protein
LVIGLHVVAKLHASRWIKLLNNKDLPSHTSSNFGYPSLVSNHLQNWHFPLKNFNSSRSRKCFVTIPFPDANSFLETFVPWKNKIKINYITLLN